MSVHDEALKDMDKSNFVGKQQILWLDSGSEAWHWMMLLINFVFYDDDNYKLSFQAPEGSSWNGTIVHRQDIG